MKVILRENGQCFKCKNFSDEWTSKFHIDLNPPWMPGSSNEASVLSGRVIDWGINAIPLILVICGLYKDLGVTRDTDKKAGNLEQYYRKDSSAGCYV